MKHPYFILIENLEKYSKTLKKNDIHQYAENTFEIKDVNFKKLQFFRDVESITGIKVKEHEYITSSCSNTTKCFNPYNVYGFNNVIFYFINENY